MQSFSAALPHLAMSLADLHAARGGNTPAFVKSQVGGGRGGPCWGLRQHGATALARPTPGATDNVSLLFSLLSPPPLPPPQYYFNTLLSLKDEMVQLGEQLGKP